MTLVMLAGCLETSPLLPAQTPPEAQPGIHPPQDQPAGTPPVALAIPTATSEPEGLSAYERIFVPVDRFATLLEGTTWEELRGVWTGQATSRNFATIYPTQDALAGLETVLGKAGPAVKPQASSAQVADRLMEDRLGLGIVPFDQLIPRLHALRLDGLSAVDNRLDQSKWPLAARGSMNAGEAEATMGLHKLPGSAILSNRDPSRLTVLVSTGTTAITRGTGVAIENAGDPAFPAEVIGPELAAADITTVSNEIPFMEGCVPDNSAGLMTFCAKPEWFATLQLSGVNLVGLTGNHLIDFGTEAFSQTLKFYADHGIQVYGGGANDEAARAPLIVKDHGNRIAFLGANQFGPESDWAGPDSPGSARYDRDQMIAAIQAVKPKVDLVLAELQWTETDGNGDYSVTPLNGQDEDFRALSDAGATIVTGVQAHAPQAVEVRNGDRMILYGLGNLYFDQTWSWETRTGLVARHTIYEGRLLNTELLVTVINPNMQLRWATPEERIDVLGTVFKASGY
jgi:poly-gamma-glutamate synthesis protein (capsule biosynthesis protein)